MASPSSLFDVRPEDTLPLEGYTRPVDLTQSVDAAIKLSADQSTVNSLIKIGEMSAIALRNQDKPKLSVEELRQKYPQFAADFTDPLSEEGAQYVVNNKLKRAELSRLVEEGPKGAIASGIRFTAGLIPHALDPVNLVAGMGATAMMGRLAMGTRAAMLTEGAFARSVTEGVLGNVLTEPVTAFATKAEQEQYTAGQFFFNTMVGAFGMSAISYAGRKIFGAISDSLKATAHDTALRQVSQDRLPDVSKVIENFANETNVKIGNIETRLPVSTDYKYQSFNSGEARLFYLPTGAGGAVPDTTVRQTIGKHYGSGVYLSDNVVVSNNVIASAYADRVGNGMIREMDISAAKLLSLDGPLPAELKASVLSIPEINKLVDGDELASGKELFEKLNRAEIDGQVPVGTLDRVNDIIKQNGYDGTHYTRDKTIIDEPHEPHNVAILFDDSKMSQRQYFGADESLVPVPSQDRLRGLFQEEQAPERALGYSESDVSRVQGLYAQAAEAKTDLDSVERGLNERIDQLTSQEKIENLPPEARAEYEGLLEAKRGIEQEREAWKALEECIRGG